jgi:hypothetical protein
VPPITEDRVKIMITDGLKEYEREVVEPRHVETQRELDIIKRLIQQGSGAVKFGSLCISAASLIWIVLQIIHHLGK